MDKDDESEWKLPDISLPWLNKTKIAAVLGFDEIIYVFGPGRFNIHCLDMVNKKRYRSTKYLPGFISIDSISRKHYISTGGRYCYYYNDDDGKKKM